mmetsp:Transcript_10423/g.27053  ORF Transcript_10423/g.27053 Transcript_10423/m.27053 type:complete len:142 (-) Transcript_10423:88-513(-)|eukprot:CAMPEP_0174919076 /NCGR_PEP_ID=MMETSP1355-20121228/3466_1 /TAXON_ID=464990 /ORGANISM="Hemiselmis tepida, Strain CCMP443" /LENGTH=141 /DNA_ID=CAMNT_0016164283 /DNA_START=26 /DNA_END=451 /DNA_ORIENTATION=-
MHIIPFIYTGEGAHTTNLVAPDFVWQRSYAWYPDTPGQYPASKMTWYYQNGGLYDQAHQYAPGAGIPMAEEEEQQPKATQASPGHIMVAGQACILGAIEATHAVLSGREEGGSWVDAFKASSERHAAAVSPLAGETVRRAA